MSFPKGIEKTHDIQLSNGASFPIFNRELSWLSFNYRVLQEAKDTSVPLYEKIRFLAIYSSNLDEFFRVRVGTLRHMMRFSEKAASKLHFNPFELHKDILKTVELQQQEFLTILYDKVIPELNKNNIHLVNEDQLDRDQAEFVRDYFTNYVMPWTRPMLLIKNKISAFLKNDTLYLLIRMVPKDLDENTEKRKRNVHYASLEIPTDQLSRWVVLPRHRTGHAVMFLDDVIRFNLSALFPGYHILEAKSVKLSRDADMPIPDEYSGNILNKIRKQIEKRRIGVTSRVVYDRTISDKALRYFREAFSVKEEDLLPSDRYHNFDDLATFPQFEKPAIHFDPLPPLAHPAFNLEGSIMDQARGKRILLYYPYHAYDPVMTFLYQAARDPDVIAIKITLYRVAKDSKLIKALRKAAEKGKDVTVFAEVKARFDEMSNIIAGEKLESSGVNVLYSLPGIKVHTKLCMVTRRENGRLKRYSYLATGNFNENTSRIYCDFGYFTDDEAVAKDIRRIFKSLAGLVVDQDYKTLLVAPTQMRDRFYKLIDFEIRQAEAGKKAEMMLKMNSLEDKGIIAKLYEASKAGVRIRIIVRGICCLIPGIKGLSNNIEIISIVDRYLEHARVFWFYHGGTEKLFLSSADWMTRNLNRRIESAFEIDAPKLREIVKQILDIQWRDNVKARHVDGEQQNRYVKQGNSPVRSQVEIHDYLRKANPVETSSADH